MLATGSARLAPHLQACSPTGPPFLAALPVHHRSSIAQSSARPAVGSPSSAPPTAAGRRCCRTLAAGTQLGTIAGPELASAAAEWEEIAAAEEGETAPALANKPARRMMTDDDALPPPQPPPPPPPPPPPQAARHTAPPQRDRPYPEPTPGNAVTLAGQRFDSLLHMRYELRALQRRLLGDLEEVAVPPSSPHFALILAVFRLHPKYARKVREPITSFFVVRNPFVLGGRGCEFQFEDARGVRDDFSLLKCTRPALKPTSRLQLMEACAHAVEPQLQAAAAAAVEAQQWRQREYGDGEELASSSSGSSSSTAPRCCRCGSDFKVAVAYAGWPLSKLVHTFRESDAPSRPPLRFGVHPQTRQAVFTSADADAAWAAAWRAYHHQHARLELLCKCCAGAQADARRARRWEAQHAGQRSMPSDII